MKTGGTMKRKASGARARDRERHEADVLAAAERLFARSGFAATTMAAIAAEAGFAIATLYNLFESKEAILELLVLAHVEAIARETRGAIDAAATPREKLEASVLARARYLGAHRDFFRLYVGETPGVTVGAIGDEAGVARIVRKQLAALARIFAELGAGGLAPSMRALVFYGATRGYIIERILRSNRPLKLAEVRQLVRTLLDGLGR